MGVWEGGGGSRGGLPPPPLLLRCTAVLTHPCSSLPRHARRLAMTTHPSIEDVRGCRLARAKAK